MKNTNTIVANAVAAYNPVAKNASTVEEQRNALAELPKFKSFVAGSIAENKSVAAKIDALSSELKALAQKAAVIKRSVVKFTDTMPIDEVPDSLWKCSDLPAVSTEIKRLYGCFGAGNGNATRIALDKALKMVSEIRNAIG